MCNNIVSNDKQQKVPEFANTATTRNAVAGAVHQNEIKYSFQVQRGMLVPRLLFFFATPAFPF